MDGYFTALICGPVFVSPSQALQQVLGEDFVFEGTLAAGMNAPDSLIQA